MWVYSSYKFMLENTTCFVSSGLRLLSVNRGICPVLFYNLYLKTVNEFLSCIVSVLKRGTSDFGIGFIGFAGFVYSKSTIARFKKIQPLNECMVLFNERWFSLNERQL